MIDRDKAALACKMAIVGAGRNQTEVAKTLSFDRIFLNAFLNRRIDLLPGDIELLLDELKLKEGGLNLSALMDFGHNHP